MKWFRVDANTPGSRTSRAVLRQMGNAGFGALIRLWCFVAERGGRDPGRGVDSDGRPFTDDDYKDATGLTDEEWDRFLAILLDKDHIDRKAWEERRELYLPGMLKRADETTQRRMREDAARQRAEAPEGQPPADIVPFTPGNAGATPADAEDSPATVQDKTEQNPTDLDPSSDLSLESEQKEGAPDSPPLTLLPPVSGPTPERVFVDDWNADAVNLPKCRTMTDTRRKRIRAVAGSVPRETLRELFRYLSDDPFYNGTQPTKDHPNWTADLDFVVQPGRVVKLLERLEHVKRRGARAGARPGVHRKDHGSHVVEVENGNMRVVPSDETRRRFGALTRGKVAANA